MAKKTRDKFVFDEQLHRYTLNGEVLRGVTGLIRSGGLVNEEGAKYFTEESRWRGTRVHKACLDIDLHAYDYNALVEDAGYIESYLKWRHLANPRWRIMEEARYSKRWRYCGIPDRVGFDSKGRPLVLDFKTSATSQPWHAIQLALYDILCDDIPWGIRRRVTLLLRADGSLAKAVEYDKRTDYIKAFELLDAA